MKGAFAATAVSACALLGLGAGEAGAATTCTWGGTPTAPTGVFTITPGGWPGTFSSVVELFR